MEEYEKRYSETQKEELLFKVRGENKANEIINDIVPKLNAFFSDKIGEQVLKAGADVSRGEMLKKYKDKVYLIIKEVSDKFEDDGVFPFIYLDNSCYSSVIKIKLRFNNENKHGFIYYDGYKYILDIKDLKIIKLYDFDPVKEIDGETQYKIYLECLSLKKQFEEEKTKLRPYGLRDMIK